MRGTGTAEVIRNDNDTYRIVAEVSIPMRTWRCDDGPEVQISEVYGPDGAQLSSDDLLSFMESMTNEEWEAIQERAIDSFGTAMAEDIASRESSEWHPGVLGG